VTLNEFLGKLEHGKRSGTGWTARCPAHEDRENSLSVTEKDGKIPVHCFAGCTVESVVQALGLEIKNLFSTVGTEKKKAPPPKAELLREHIYTLADGTPAARKLRWGSHDADQDRKLKRFSRQRWLEGRWVNGLDSRQQTALPLYRLPEFLAAEARHVVILAEGEHDADAAAQMGFIATTSGGTRTFTESHAKQFVGRRVVIVSHPKPQERAEAEKRAALLHGHAANVKIVMMPGVKDLADAIDAGTPKAVIDALIAEARPWAPATGADLLNDTERMVARYVHMEDHCHAIVALWIAHTYVVEANHFTPYLYITSPERSCGKSTLLDLLEMLCSNPMLTASISPSALYRAIEKWKPTLLIDEIENLLSGDQNQDSDLLGVLNSGFKKGTPAIRNAGLGAQMEPAKFETFGAKALAGIGRVKDTILSRSLTITLKRALPSEVEVLEYDAAKHEATELAAKLSAWIQPKLNALASAKPEVPPELGGRERNISKPLLAIADLAGAEWPLKGREAIKKICSQARSCEQSKPAQLLEHLRLKFQREDGTLINFLPTAEILDFLTSRDDWPWAERGKSKKPLTGPSMAYMLKEFGIRPVQKSQEGRIVRGYESTNFVEAWKRYCDLPMATDSFTASSIESV
jgi:Protein of unknown function (DUF3631)